jgi:hypothetical protein
MSIFSKRNLIVGIATFVIAVGSTCSESGAFPGILRRTTTINGQVSAYLLDDRGAVDGLLLREW